MKASFFLGLALAIATTAIAQPGIQPSSSQFAPNALDTVVNISLKARHHAYILSFMGDRGSVDRIKYINQVVEQVTDTSLRNKDVVVTVPASLVVDLYRIVGSQQERITTVYNAEIKQALLPQIVNVPPLLAAIQAIAQGNALETERMVIQGLTFLKKLND